MSSAGSPQSSDPERQLAKEQLQQGVRWFRLTSGDRGVNLLRSIDSCGQALRYFTLEAAPQEHALIQNLLGLVYLEVPSGDRAVDLTRAIASFTKALRFFTAETAPQMYGETMYNLGVAYADLPSADRPVNLARAIACFTDALKVLTAAASPDNYARAQSRLGSAYAELATGDPAANLSRAIACYKEALRIYTPESAPVEYAGTQHNLGNAYVQLPTWDQAANLLQAIGCFTKALRFRTAEAAPLDYASTQSGLGAAFLALRAGDRSISLRLAIGCFAEALRFYTAEAFPMDYAAAQYSMGAACVELHAGDRPATLAQAISCFTAALRIYTAGAAPREYAVTQTSLAGAYIELHAGDQTASEAIKCLTEALRFLTAEESPKEYAGAMHNLGAAYIELYRADREVNLARAISCLTEALRFRTAEADPSACRLTARRLGEVYFELGRWMDAHTAYSAAIEAAEFLYQVTGTEAARHAELEAAGDAVAADAYCLARLGRLNEAVRRLEAGRVRALGEALAQDRANLQKAHEADRAAFVAAAQQIRALEAEGRRGPNTIIIGLDGPSMASLSARLVRARKDLADVIGRIRRYQPGFEGHGLTYAEITATASPDRPLVYLLTTSRGSAALLVQTGFEASSPQQAVWLDGITIDQLNELLVQRDASGQARGGYLVGQLSGDLRQLGASLRRNLEVVRRELLGPLAVRLANLGIAAATIVPVGRLSLLPLPAAAPDEFAIALAPSARVLKAARQALQERVAEEPVLFAVSNPLPLPAGWQVLRYAGVEVRAIEQFFAAKSRRILPEQEATATAVVQALPGATHLHLACHSNFDPREPLDSGVYLSGADRLTVRDLLDGDLDLSSQVLAVLSACQTGLTEFNRVPDELIGLPAGLLRAGIPGVVATLWPVNDRSTAVLIAEFYRLLLAERKDPATALAAARQYLRDAKASGLAAWFERRYQDSGGTDQVAYEAATALRSLYEPAERPYADPVYWAGFVYYGA
jgi:CHAT domain-containing protein